MNLPLALVEWLDSAKIDVYDYPPEVQEPVGMILYSVGYIKHHKKFVVVYSAKIADGRYRDRLDIPTRIIRRITKLAPRTRRTTR